MKSTLTALAAGLCAAFATAAFANPNAADRPLAVCAPDIKAHCANVEPGEGRVLKCVRESLPKFSAACQAAIEDAKDHRDERREALKARKARRDANKS